MASKLGKISLSVLLVVVACLAIAGSLIGNEASAHIGGRTVWAESANALSRAQVSMDAAGAVVQLGEKRVTVTGEKVLLPGGAVVALPAACRRIALRETDDGVRVLLDDVAAN